MIQEERYVWNDDSGAAISRILVVAPEQHLPTWQARLNRLGCQTKTASTYSRAVMHLNCEYQIESKLVSNGRNPKIVRNWLRERCNLL